jgi:spore germination protein
MRDLTKEPLTQDEMKTLKALYQHSKEITGSIRDVQTKVIANGLRWMDVETALATEQNMLDNTIIDGFQTVNKKVSEYDDLNFGESVVGAADKKSFRALAGNDVSVDEIKQKAAQWAGIQDVSAVQVVENGDGADRSVYSVTVKKPGSDHEIAMDFSKKGGQLIWFMISRPVGGKTKGMEEATQIARTYLDGHGYRDMTPVNYEEYQNTASIAFAGKSGDVIVYPDLVTVNVALDNGEVVGMNAADYLLKHQTRNLKKPALTMEQARKSLHPEFQIADQATALIENETGKEVLCYQFTGKVNGSVYRIYINADNGTEEKVEEMRELPAPARS